MLVGETTRGAALIGSAVMNQSSLYLKQLQLGPMQNFTYLIADAATREAMVVDPGWEVERILDAVRRDDLRVTKAVVTHHHFDHVGALPKLLEHVDVPVYVHRDDAPFLELSETSLRLVDDGDTIAVGGMQATVIHTPGHTPGSQCLLVQGHLLTGDTLFVQACGRWDLPGGDVAALFGSLTRLKQLDGQTVVCPGHDYGPQPTSTIAEEQRTNPFLQPGTREDFLRFARR